MEMNGNKNCKFLLAYIFHNVTSMLEPIVLFTTSVSAAVYVKLNAATTDYE